MGEAEMKYWASCKTRQREKENLWQTGWEILTDRQFTVAEKKRKKTSYTKLEKKHLTEVFESVQTVNRETLKSHTENWSETTG